MRNTVSILHVWLMPLAPCRLYCPLHSAPDLTQAPRQTRQEPFPWSFSPAFAHGPSPRALPWPLRQPFPPKLSLVLCLLTPRVLTLVLPPSSLPNLFGVPSPALFPSPCPSPFPSPFPCAFSLVLCSVHSLVLSVEASYCGTSCVAPPGLIKIGLP